MKRFQWLAVAGICSLTTVAQAYVENDLEKPIPDAARERAIIEAMATGAARGVKKTRDAHAKANGCIDDVNIEVRKDLPATYQVGVFVAGKTYKGILRSSNGSGDLGVSDPAGGGQGLALKMFLEDEATKKRLHKIAGEVKFKEVDDKYYDTFDILGINFPEFFSPNVPEYPAFSAASGAANAASQAEIDKQEKLLGRELTRKEANKIKSEVGPPIFAAKFFRNEKGEKIHEREGKVIAALGKKTLNPLVEDFHSMVPSLFGKDEKGNFRAVKYRLHPCDKDAKANYVLPKDIDEKNDDDFLRTTLARHLSSGDTCYKISVQFTPEGLKKEDVTKLVEDAVTRWSEAPKWVELATVTVKEKPKNRELTDDNTCEWPSYSPWRTLPETQPIGGIQRARERIYAEVFRARHENLGHTKR